MLTKIDSKTLTQLTTISWNPRQFVTDYNARCAQTKALDRANTL
ncbi:hypothetical protein [Levilactobacillus acidifarinae]|nr:hypothetical protein [Levilactobacillus acidifarinae]GEO68173.1 hypothetical protein LAC03_00830 [Levilactobacillus acidifarinae]